MMKRAMDLLVAAIGLLALSPLFLLIGLLVKLDSSGPVFFGQVRIGRRFRPFRIYKFRTMTRDASSNGGQLTIGEDIRITRVGRVLRRHKLDELPQLLNILLGDMSLVGPRPEVSQYVDLFKTDYSEILSVRPGLTDLASVKYADEATILAGAQDPEDEYRTVILPEKIRLAKLYVRHASFAFDVAIIAQTVFRLTGLPLVLCEIPELQSSHAHPFGEAGSRAIAWLLRWRRPLIVAVDLALIVCANYLAFLLRFDGTLSESETQLFLQVLPWLVAIRGGAFMVFSLNEGLWRYTGIWDLQRIVSGVFLSTAAIYGLVYWGFELTAYPRSILIIDSVLLIGLVTGIRLPSRLLGEKLIYRHKKNVLVVGAGQSGERIVREMKTNSFSRYQPVGLIDDDVSLLNKRIHGVKVLGTRSDLPRLLAEKQVVEVVLALSNARPALLREIISTLEPFKVSIKTLPNLSDLLADRSAESQMRSVSMNDLLPRAVVNSQDEAMRHMIKGRRVLITGAGGSIGSELSRQVAALGPESLVLYERHENSLYMIAKELDDQGLGSFVHPVLGDVTDVSRLTSTVTKYRPSIFFHAAAHKHVPLVELNPAEALKNNCMGTRITAEVAHRLAVERFVLISTDKAVNPSSVMGATKRVAELIVQGIARQSKTRFITVRFGNVLGSNGSVLLRFQEQIRAGGPVTVTDPGVRRYFMLIPEAVHLVLQAASLGEQGATYILNMGEQISVLDLARNLIRLSGFVPGQEIPIQFVGLRPGEKLAEELVGEGEATEQSMIENILRIRRMAPIDFDNLQNKVTALEAAARLNHTTWAIDRLRELVPEFHSPGELERAPVPAMPATREDLSVSRKAGSLVESGATPSL